jgi:hypothetical protein
VGPIVALALETDGEGLGVFFTTQAKVRIEAKRLYGTAGAGTYFRIGEHQRCGGSSFLPWLGAQCSGGK